MKTLLAIVVVFVAATNTAVAQNDWNSSARQPHYGYYPGKPVYQSWYLYDGSCYYHASTWQESILRGQAALLDASGRCNHLNSLARINELQVQRLDQENKSQFAESQLRLRQIREAESRSRMALIRQQNAALPRAQPAPITPMPDAAAWPKLLQDDELAGYRDQVNQILCEKARTGRVPAANYQQIQQMTETILADLQADIRNVRPQDYVAVKSFARNLLADLRSPRSPDDHSGARELPALAKSAN